MKIIDRKFLKYFTKSCHAATMAFYQDKPVYAWFGGRREGLADSNIFVQFGDKVQNFQSDDIPKWNPILFPYKDQLFLFTKSGIFCDRWNTFLYDLSDIFVDCFHINTVAKTIIPAGINGPVKTKPIVYHNSIYCGSSVETIYDWSSYIEKWTYSEQDKSLKFLDRTPPLCVPKKVYELEEYGMQYTSLGIIQPSLWIDKHGNLNAFFRSSKGLWKIYHSSCSANGDWSAPKPTSFDNPNSGVDTVYHKGRLFLVHNPSKTLRNPLVISELSGSFEVVDEITITEKIDEKEDVNTLELSYPYLIENNDQLHLCYSYGRKKIEHVIIEI